MKILKAIKSTFETIGMAVVVFFTCGYIDGTFVIDNLYYSLLISAAVVWISNKALRWQGEHFELEECPYCGAAGGGTRLGKIQRMDFDEMGEFLMKWGIACIKDEEPRDVFKWLGCRGGIWTEDE